jgi:hypothetical protein
MDSLGELAPTAKLLQQNTASDPGKLHGMVHGSCFEILEFGSYFMKPFHHEKCRLR